jgi:hypothetical protein
MAHVTWARHRAIARRLEKIRKAADPGSNLVRQCRDDILRIIVEGHREGVLSGTDRYGSGYAPLAPRTLKTRKGDGPPLAPRSLSSRIWTHFYGYWTGIHQSTAELVAGWRGIPWIRFHITGGPRLPRRDPAGLRPQTEQKIIARHKQLLRDIRSAK